MKLAWLTDPHLDSADKPAHRALAGQLEQCRPDALLISGDIGQAASVIGYLDWLAEVAGCPVYFVLGNHDFYGGSIPVVREAVRAHAAADRRLSYLTGAAAVTLCPEVALVGHDGWGDGRVGRAMESPVRLVDFYEIQELMGLKQAALVERLEGLGAEAADTLEPTLLAALGSHEHVLVVTHVPPTPESAWHEGQSSDDDWSPFFVCGAMGAMLQRVAAAHPRRRITVLCGHSHSAGEVWIRPNLQVRTGGAEYGKPGLQAPLMIMDGAW